GFLTVGTGESQPVSVWVDDQHLPRAPRAVLRRLDDPRAAITEGRTQGVHVVDHEVCSPTDLAVPRMLCEEQGEAVHAHLGEHGQARLERMLPLDPEAQVVLVERAADRPIRHAELRDDALLHTVPLGAATSARFSRSLLGQFLPPFSAYTRHESMP